MLLEKRLLEHEERALQYFKSAMADCPPSDKWLIQARIARGLAQEDLAKLLNLKKQQIQSYEASDYASASLSRIMEIARMLHSEPDSAVS
ncbi:MAG: helix-turn-helix domain-containing protein [Candidatus Obscuribacterales bacterium]|nr:helix-turn-helix domain-containing protein [Candidatus Obscuribacterales bacterium]